MIWGISILVVAGIFLFGIKEYRKQRRADEAFSQAFADAYGRFSQLIASRNISIPDPQMDGYNPVRGEIVFGFSKLLRDHDRDIEGRLIVTNKALVFESQARSDRLVYPSLSHIEAKRDGVEMRKRNGPRRAFRTGDPELLALIVAAFHTGQS